MKQQEKERRRKRFGMEFMERDVAGGGCKQEGTSQQKCIFSIKTELLPDIERDRTHRSEGGVLHDDKDQWVTDDQEKRGKEKNDRLDMIPKKRDTCDRHLEPPVDKLPKSLGVIGEIEGPVFEVRPACAGCPGTNGEEDQCEAENRSLF